MTPRYFREAHQVGRRRVGHASVLRSRCPAAYLVKVAVDQSTTEPSISNQAPPLTTRPHGPGANTWPVQPSARTSSRSMVPPGTSRSRSRDRRHAHRWLVSRPSGAATTPEISAQAIFDRSHADDLATWPPGTTGDDPPAGCPRSRRVDVSTPTRSAVWSPSPAALVAGGGEPAGVQILPIRVPFEAMEIRRCGT